MPRILALADVHIGAGAALGRTLRGEGSRLEDQRQVLARIVEVAADQQVELALVAGDLLHRPRPSVTELLVAAEFLRALSIVCPVVVISGNAGHDGATPTEPSPIELFAGMPDVVVATGPMLVEVAGVDVACLPGTPPSHLAAQRPDQDRDTLHTDMAAMLVEVAAGLRAQCASGRPAVLVAHWSVSGASLPNGLAAEQLREPVLNARDLQGLAFDEVVLGHIHSPDVLWARGAYCGSPLSHNFGEAGVPHGVWILDTDAAGFDTFIDIPSRRLVSVEGAWSPDAETIYTPDFVLYELAGAIVRYRYECTADQARRVDESAIRRALYDAGAHKVANITAEITAQDRARVAEMRSDLDDDQALDLYLESRETPAEIAGPARTRHGHYAGKVPA